MYICRGLYNRERERECKQCSNVAKTIAVLSAKAKLVRKKNIPWLESNTWPNWELHIGASTDVSLEWNMLKVKQMLN